MKCGEVVIKKGKFIKGIINIGEKRFKEGSMGEKKEMGI